MASINGIEAVELLPSADPALGLAVRQRGRLPVFERTAAQPHFVNGIRGVIFADASGGTGTYYRLDDADPAVALAARQRGQRPILVVDSSGAVVASAPAAPVNTVAPVISGTLIEGQTLSATTGTWTGSPAPTYTYQWQADTAGNGTFANIGGATNSSYLLTSGEVGDDVRVVVTATNASGAVAANSVETATIAALDTTPAAFSFTDVTDATLSTLYESDQITVTGINGTATVTITGGEYSKNGGSYTSSAGTAVVNDTFKVRHTSSGSDGTATSTVLTIGGVSDTYTTTTASSAEWFEDSAHNPLAAVMDFNNDRYALPTLGTNLVETGTFDASTGWTLFVPEWTISGSKLNATNVGAYGQARYTTTTQMVVGKVYEVTYTVSNYSSGNVQITLSGRSGAVRTANGTYTEYLIPTVNSFVIDITPTTGSTTLKLDDVSVKEVILTATGRTYGSELILNGDFTAAATGNPATGWALKTPAVGTETMTISGGTLNLTGDGTNAAYADQSIATTNLQVYEFTATVTNSATSLSIGTSQGGTTIINAMTLAVSTIPYVFKFVATGTTTWIRFAKTAAANGIVDNVSIRALTAIGTYPKRTATFDECFVTSSGYAASDSARTYIDSGGTLRPMTYERTNLQSQSQTLDNAAWTASQATVANTAVVNAPDGTATADLFTENTATSAHAVYGTGSFSFTTGFSYTASIHVKAGTGRYISLRGEVAGAHPWVTLDTQTGTISGNGQSSSTSAVETLANGWFRLSLTWRAATTASGGNIVIASSDTSAAPTGTDNLGNSFLGTSRTYYLWGAQVEPHAFVSPYIPTTTAAITNGVNARRMTYANGKRQLRLENTSTNRFWYSESFGTSSYWTPSASPTIAADAAVAPNGTTTADKITTTANDSYIYQSGHAVTASVPSSFSIYAKADTTNFLSISVGTGGNQAGAVFNLTTGAVTQAHTAGTFTIQSNSAVDVGNGWWRCILVLTPGSSTAIFPVFGPCNSGTPTRDANGNVNNAGIGSSCYLWGAQSESSAFATDYIPTPTNSGVNRAIETARLSPLLEAVLQRAQGSVVVRCDSSNPVTTLNGGLVGISSTSSLVGLAANSGSLESWSAGGTELTLGGITNNRDSLGAAMGFDASGRSLAGNGLVGKDALASSSSRAEIYLGRTTSNTSIRYGDGYYDLLGISPERLPDSNLTSLAVAAP